VLLFGSEAVNTSGEAVRGLVMSANFTCGSQIPSRALLTREYGGSTPRPVTNPTSYAGKTGSCANDQFNSYKIPLGQFKCTRNMISECESLGLNFFA